MARPIVLTILDGWGYRRRRTATRSRWPASLCTTACCATFPNTLLRASDHFVGLPDGQMGNSEVGHLNLGAGRIVRMDMTRIDTAIADGSFFTDPTLLAAITAAQEKDGALHFIGLLSDGGVHSHQRHLYALLKLARAARSCRASSFMPSWMAEIHADQRARLPREVEQQFREIGVGQLASVSGRYYAMDRDLRWEKERQAFDALVTGHPGGRHLCRAAGAREGAVQQRDYGRVHSAVHGRRRRGPRRRSDPRQRRGDQLQLPRRPRAADYPRAGAQLRPDAERRASTCRRPRSSIWRFRAAWCRRTSTTSA